MNKAIGANGIQPLKDKVFEVDELSEALGYLDKGQHFGKVVLNF